MHKNVNQEKNKATFLNQFAFFISVPALLWQVFFLLVPVFYMVAMSFSTNKSFFSLHFYVGVFEKLYIESLMRSFFLALSTTFFCFICAYPVAYFLALYVNKWKNILFFLIILPFWTNVLVQVYAWFFILEPYGIVNSFLLKIGFIQEPLMLLNSTLAVFLGMVYCYMPFMIMPLYILFESFDIKYLEASADLGATSIETFRYITLPMSLAGIKTGFFLVFIPVFGEFLIPTLLGGGKKLYVGTLITHFFLIMQEPKMGAAFTVISGIVLFFSATISYWCLKKIILRAGRISK